MAEPFLSELRIFSFAFAPKGWALCNGQLLPINQNQALFSLLGTTYGGDGRVNFALPDLRGRVPHHEGSGHTLGENGGSETVTVNINQLPTHNHLVNGSDAVADAIDPTGSVWGNSGKTNYTNDAPNNVMVPNAFSNVGGSQPHENRMPFLVLSICIALQGIFPSPN
jgi:microcystin-dependent protein